VLEPGPGPAPEVEKEPEPEAGAELEAGAMHKAGAEPELRQLEEDEALEALAALELTPPRLKWSPARPPSLPPLAPSVALGTVATQSPTDVCWVWRLLIRFHVRRISLSLGFTAGGIGEHLSLASGLPGAWPARKHPLNRPRAVLPARIVRVVHTVMSPHVGHDCTRLYTTVHNCIQLCTAVHNVMLSTAPSVISHTRRGAPQPEPDGGGARAAGARSGRGAAVRAWARATVGQVRHRALQTFIRSIRQCGARAAHGSWCLIRVCWWRGRASFCGGRPDAERPDRKRHRATRAPGGALTRTRVVQALALEPEPGPEGGAGAAPGVLDLGDYLLDTSEARQAQHAAQQAPPPPLDSAPI
jgi:hypothetical protein